MKNAEDTMYKAKLLEDKSLRNSLLSSLLKTLYEKNDKAEEHGKKLVLLAQKIGTSMNMDKSQLADLKLLALLQDLGKIGISEELLNKPCPLNEIELAEIQKHSEIGFRIASTTPDLIHIAKPILHIHEHWNGEGYPHKLKKEDIPLFSRIISVIDAYQTIISKKNHNTVFSHSEALEKINDYAGTIFDPFIVNKFLALDFSDIN